MDIYNDNAVDENGSWNPSETNGDQILDAYAADPKMQKIFELEEAFRGCVGLGIAAEVVIEYIAARFLKRDIRSVPPVPAPAPIKSPSKEDPAPSRTGSNSENNFFRLVEEIIKQPKSKQRSHLDIARKLWESPNLNYRQLARDNDVCHQTVANLVKKYREILNSEPEAATPKEDEGLVQVFVLWASSQGRDFSIGSFKPKELTKKIILGFAGRVYPQCYCRWRHRPARPQNIKRYIKKLAAVRRPIHLCPKCASKHQRFHGFRLTTFADENKIAAVANFITNLRSDPRFLARFHEVRTELNLKYGWSIFDRITPMPSANVMNLFRPEFAAPSFRSQMLSEYSNKNESRLMHLAASLAERISMQEEYPGFELDDTVVFPALDRIAQKFVSQREQNTTRASGASPDPLTLLHDPVVRQELQKLLPKSE